MKTGIESERSTGKKKELQSHGKLSERDIQCHQLITFLFADMSYLVGKHPVTVKPLHGCIAEFTGELQT